MRAVSSPRHERGSSAAEFALILPIFILFLLGMIDVGRWVWSFSELEKATQTGARWAVATCPTLPVGRASGCAWGVRDDLRSASDRRARPGGGLG